MMLDLSGAAALAATHRNWLNEIAVSSERPFNDLVQRLGAPHAQDIDWWVTPIASRNIFASALFLRCCRFLLAIRVVETGSPLRGIVVETPGFAAALRKALARRNHPVPVMPRHGAARFRATLLAGMGYRMAAALFHAAGQAIYSRLTRGSAPPPSGPITLIDTFAYRDSFDSEYRDRHYPGLIEQLTESERRDVYFLPSYYKVKGYRRFFRALRASTANLMVKEDYLRAADYAYALTHPLRSLRFKVQACPFENDDVAPIVNEALAESFASSGTIEGLLRYRLAQRLRDSGPSIRLLVDWFENQEIDHGSNAGFRRYLPETPVVGYQGFVVSRHYLSTFPTSDEMRLKLTPHRMAVTGPGLVERAQAFCPGMPVEVAPAFRFAGLWRGKAPRINSNEFRILVALPLMPQESVEILALMADAASEFAAAGHVGDGRAWRVRVKTHPSFASSLPGNFERVEGDFDDLVGDCDVLVGSASSVCVQALAHGVPVVVLGATRGITLNPIPEDFERDMWSVCYTAAELVTALQRFAQRDAATIERYRASGLALRDRLFSPVTRESVLRFLGLEDGPRAASRALAPNTC
jgi:hypothetical protein